MSHPFRFLSFLASAATLMGIATVAPVTAAGDSVYERLYSEFTSHPNRLVGSDAIQSCFTSLSNELASAGLEPRFQTFDSLVQKTERCTLTVDGKVVEGALMVDNGLASWSLPAPLSGPVLYVGNGELSALEGKDLTGAIAVLDTRKGQAAELEESFMHGAAAVLVVGDGTLSQWDAVDLLVRSVSLVPCIYLDAERAEAAGLLNGTAKKATIDAFSHIVDTEGQNLWVVLPGEDGWKGNLDTEEVLLLSATLDTYGFTPDYTPDCRRAANAALLADVLCRMAETPHKRTIVGAFFGSSYAAVEGARHFYYSIALTDKSLYSDDLAVRKERLLEEQTDIANLLKLAQRDDVLDASDADSRTVAQAYKKLLTASVNRIREPIGKLNARRAPSPSAATSKAPPYPPAFSPKSKKSMPKSQSSKSRRMRGMPSRIRPPIAT